MNNLRKFVSFDAKNTHANPNRGDTLKAVAVHILYVGPLDRGSLVHDAMLDGPHFRLTLAPDYRELWRMPTQRSFQVAIVHNSHSMFETEAVCRLIRRRWPGTKILLVIGGSCFLEAVLYDDRVAPTVFPEVLLETIGRITGVPDEQR
jgi:hypothetical protein